MAARRLDFAGHRLLSYEAGGEQASTAAAMRVTRSPANGRQRSAGQDGMRPNGGGSMSSPAEQLDRAGLMHPAVPGLNTARPEQGADQQLLAPPTLQSPYSSIAVTGSASRYSAAWEGMRTSSELSSAIPGPPVNALTASLWLKDSATIVLARKQQPGSHHHAETLSLRMPCLLCCWPTVHAAGDMLL